MDIFLLNGGGKEAASKRSMSLRIWKYDNTFGQQVLKNGTSFQSSCKLPTVLL